MGAAFKANYAAAFPGLRIYSNHKEMLVKESPLDIVTVGVSDHRHADIVVDAANAGVKGIFCEKPLATTLEDTDRMVEACEANGVVLSIDHTRRFLPIWRYCKEQIVDKGELGEIQYIISRLHGPRSMMWRNGTHNIDVMLWFAGSKPRWVMGDFEEGFEDYDRYGQRGMDGGRDPTLEPAVNGYISFENGVKGFFVGVSPQSFNPPLARTATDCSVHLGDTCICTTLQGSKKTPTNIKMEVEIVGDGGRLVIDNAGDGRDENGEWTGTYHASASLWRQEAQAVGRQTDGQTTQEPERIVPSEEYIARITPPQRGEAAGGWGNEKVDTNVKDAKAPMIGIAAGVHDLINVVLSDGTAPIISSGRNAQDVVEVLSGFVKSAHGGNVPVQLPLPRDVAAKDEVAETTEAAARL